MNWKYILIVLILAAIVGGGILALNVWYWVKKAEGKFCGGIAANLPEYQCPFGYRCQLEGNYPDASGVCVKDPVFLFIELRNKLF